MLYSVEVVFLQRWRIVRAATSADQVEADKLATFAPKFTYHAFGTQETVEGYEGLQISVSFSAFDFSAWLDVQFEEKQPSYVCCCVPSTLVVD